MERRALVLALFLVACDAPVHGVSAQAPPPAPMVTTSRDDVVRMLRSAHPERCLPFTVSSTSPLAVVRIEDGAWVLRSLALDRAAADAEGRRRRAAGQPWMPEHEHAFLRPGAVVARGHTAAELASAIENVRDWSARGLGPVSTGQARELCRAAR